MFRATTLETGNGQVWPAPGMRLREPYTLSARKFLKVYLGFVAKFLRCR